MSTLIEIAVFLIRSLATVYLLAILLRFLMQVARADFYNPIARLVVKATNPLLLPLRKIVPSMAGLDTASLLLAFGFQWVVIQLLCVLLFQQWPPFSHSLLWALLANGLFVANIYLVILFVLMIASFIAPYSRHPALMLVQQLAEPFLAPFRRLIPPMGGLDLSFFVAGLGLYVIRIALTGLANNAHLPPQVVLLGLGF